METVWTEGKLGSKGMFSHDFLWIGDSIFHIKTHPLDGISRDRIRRRKMTPAFWEKTKPNSKCCPSAEAIHLLCTAMSRSFIPIENPPGRDMPSEWPGLQPGSTAAQRPWVLRLSGTYGGGEPTRKQELWSIPLCSMGRRSDGSWAVKTSRQKFL